ncbi:MAG TPA: type II toxin-antitoxin system YafQ family toxin [Lachnospiraceae bacterium]|nr:type II toxin-antitoxin system YafQ family toxin [Lachnospiraceae bacterium]
MKYIIQPTNRFKRDLRLVQSRGYQIALLSTIISKLSNGEMLDEKNKDHDLHGNWEGYRECHIQPDWLLIYKIDDNDLILYLTRTGTHSDLF